MLVLCNNVDEVSERVHTRLAIDFGATRVRHVNGMTSATARREALQVFRDPANADTGVFAMVGTVGTVGVGVTAVTAAMRVEVIC